MKSYDDIRRRIEGFGPTIQNMVAQIRDAKQRADATALGNIDSQLERLGAELTQASTAMAELGAGREPETLNGNGEPWQSNDGKNRGAFFVADNGEHYLLVEGNGTPNDDGGLIDAGVKKFRASAAGFPAQGQDAIPDDVLRSRIVVEDFTPGAVTAIDQFPGAASVQPATAEPEVPLRNEDAAAV